MISILTKVTGRRIEVDVPEDWPEGTEVEIHPRCVAGDKTEPPSPDDWRNRILETAGKWQGEFERPDQGDYEERDPLS